LIGLIGFIGSIRFTPIDLHRLVHCRHPENL
jgi:hypothetical protein